VKGRPAERALPLIAADAAQVRRHLGPLSATGARLAERFWPGPLTILVAAPPDLARDVCADDGTVGVRVPGDPVVRAIAAGCGRPITATSANLSGEPATTDPEEVERALGDRIDLLIDTGRTRGGAPSTKIVDITGPEPRLVRAGAIPWDEVQAWLDA
jgi:L-threonylcarbamoyladenylate synthase